MQTTMLDTVSKDHQALMKLAKMLSVMLLTLTALIRGGERKRKTRSMIDTVSYHYCN